MSIEEVDEWTAEGKVRTILEDVRVTLAIPTAGFLFRWLAAYPWFLQLAWRNLKPNVSTAYFHEATTAIRLLALESARSSSGDGPRGPAEDSFEQALHAVLDLDSKLLLSAAALWGGSSGQLPRMHVLPAEDLRLPSSSPPPRLDWRRASESTATRTAALSALTRDLPWTANCPSLPVLIGWIDDLKQSWEAAIRDLDGDRVREGVAELRQRTSMATEAFPFRLEISATACRQAGLTEDQIDRVRQIIAQACEILPREILLVARLARHERSGFGFQRRENRASQPPTENSEPGREIRSGTPF